MEKTKIILIWEARSGTHFLMSLMNSNPKCKIYGELLQFRNTQYSYKYSPELVKAAYNLDMDETSRLSNNKWIVNKNRTHLGYLIHRSQITKKIQNIFKEDKDIKYIYMKRDDHLKRFISKEIASKYNSFSSRWKLDQNTIKPFKISINNLFEYIKIHDDNYDKYLDYLNSIWASIFTISYEELCENTYKTMDELFNFIGLDTVESDKYTKITKKQITKPLNEIVLNYDEINKILTTPILYKKYKEEFDKKIVFIKIKRITLSCINWIYLNLMFRKNTLSKRIFWKIINIFSK